MALTTTTLAAACGVNDTTIRVTSATGFVPQQLIRIDDEMLAQASAGSSGTTLSVRRAVEATLPAAHGLGAAVATGTGADFAVPPPGEVVVPPSGALLRQATVTLTDAQIKTLPSTPVVILPATEISDYVSTPTRLPVLVDAHLYSNYFEVNYAGADGVFRLYLSSLAADGLILAESNTAIAPGGIGNVDVLRFHFPTVVNFLPLHGFMYDNAVIFKIDSDEADLTAGAPGNTFTVGLVYLLYDTVRKAYV